MAVSFAPGRVNLVGEHIDYHDLPVLPMALERGIELDFTPRSDGQVVLRNAEPDFGERRFPVESGLTPGPPGDWGNYAMAAAVTVAERYGGSVGLDGLLSSNLPPAAGLSSSSALVVAMARALLHVAGIEPDPLELAEALAEGERFVGTAGGGMDQAASLLGRAGHAVRIRFHPFAVEPVPFPENWTVVVAHSGVSAEKSGGAREAYNARRRESTAALAELARRMGEPGSAPRELLERHGPGRLLERCRDLEGPGGPWASHALTEAARVGDAVSALRERDLVTFGDLLNRSHASLRDVYRVSHPRLDRLVEAARDAGAAGARLTGAGFGGCMLAVCVSVDAGSVVERLREAQLAMDPPPDLEPFTVHPGSGARVAG